MATHLGSAFATIPWWFIAVALIFSVCHGGRGYVFQCAVAYHQQAQPDSPFHQWSRRQTIVTRCAYDGFFHAFCSMTGFAALWLAGYVFNTMPDLHDIPGGTSAFLVFLVVLGLLGVSGQLPYLIQLGKFPK
jgi:hypothetical protein